MPPALPKKAPSKAASIKATAKPTKAEKTRTRGKAASKPAKAFSIAERSASGAEPDDEGDNDGNEEEGSDSGDEGYATAQEEAAYLQLLKSLKQGDSRKKEDRRKKREAKFVTDMAVLRGRVDKAGQEPDAAARQRTKEAALKLVQCLNKRSELEKQYMDTTNEMLQIYQRFNREMQCAVKGRLDSLRAVEVPPELEP